jgi:hypothetical protein
VSPLGARKGDPKPRPDTIEVATLPISSPDFQRMESRVKGGFSSKGIAMSRTARAKKKICSGDRKRRTQLCGMSFTRGLGYHGGMAAAARPGYWLGLRGPDWRGTCGDESEVSPAGVAPAWSATHSQTRRPLAFEKLRTSP